MKPEQRELVIDYKGHSFKLQFPNNRKYIEIQNQRARLRPVTADIDAESGYASALAEAIAFISVLSPELVKNLNVDMLEMDFEDGIELTKLFSKEIRPWFDNWMNYFFKVTEITESTEETKSE